MYLFNKNIFIYLNKNKQMSAVKQLIEINRIKIKVFLYIINIQYTHICYIYICYVYINTQTRMYIFKKNMLRLYMKYIYI